MAKQRTVEDPRVLFGRAVRRLREEQGYSQESFAEACGLHRTYIGSIERGERNVALLNIWAIAETLGGLPDTPGIFAAVPYCIDLLGGPYLETRDEVCKAFRPKSAIRPLRTA